jgi:hypothetical protein
MCDKFGAVRQRQGHERARMLTFDIDKVHRTGAVYNGRENKITIPFNNNNDWNNIPEPDADSADREDSIMEVPSPSQEETNVENGESKDKSINNSHDNQSNYANNSDYNTSKSTSSSLVPSALSSWPSQNLEDSSLFSCYHYLKYLPVVEKMIESFRFRQLGT